MQSNNNGEGNVSFTVTLFTLLQRGKKLLAITNERGFSLLELSMVLLVVGLLIGVVSTAWNSMEISQKFSAARGQLETVSNCLKQYVIHSEKIPPQSYFNGHCVVKDPWGEDVLYLNSGQNQEITHAGTKTIQDDNGTHNDVVWILISKGQDRVNQVVTTAAGWTTGSDDLYLFTTRNELVRQITQ